MEKKCLKVFSAAFALCLAFGVGNLLTATADDEVVYVEDGVAKVGFYVQNGAAVHLGDTTTGIKYATVVTKAFQDYLTSQYEGASFEWHTLITGTNMLEGGDVTKVTPDLKKPTWVGDNAGELACKNFTQTLEDMKDNEKTGEIADVDNDGQTDQKYAAAITYQNLLDDEKVSASNADLIARSYVKITQGDEETIIYSVAEDTVRNMKAVAYAAIKSGKYTASEENLYGYTGVTSADVKKNETVDSFYSLNDDSGVITVKGLDTEDCEVYYGAKKLAASVSNGVVTVSGINGLEAGEDNKYELTVFANGKIYDQAFGCATQVIDEAADLEVFNLDMTNYAGMVELKKTEEATAESYIVRDFMKTVTGYYVLAKDIDASSYAMKTQGYISRTHNTVMTRHGFQGVFDGRGYTISGLTFGAKTTLDRYTKDEDGKSTTTENGTRDYWNKNNYSLFGYIAGGTVKNFALTDVKFNLKNSGDSEIYMASCTPIAMWIGDGSTVENVYVSVKGVNAYFSVNGVKKDGCYLVNNTVVSGFAFGVSTSATLKNIVVDARFETTGDYEDVYATNALTGSFVYRKMTGAGQTTTENKWSNVVVLSDHALSYYVGTTKDPGYPYDGDNVTLPEKVDNTNYVNMPNTYRYESVDAWKTAQEDTTVTTKPDVNTFGTDYWRLVEGIPVWGKATATE